MAIIEVHRNSTEAYHADFAIISHILFFTQFNQGFIIL